MKLVICLVLVTLLTAVAASGQVMAPPMKLFVSWSPDSQSLVFTGLTATPGEGGKMNITAATYVCRVDGTGMRKLTTEIRNEFAPSWVGKKIAFGSSPAANREVADIYLSNIDGTGLVQLTHDTKRNSAPAISPNGNLIVFNSNRDGGKDMIYVMKADGTGVKQLTTDPTGLITFYNPLWSPNGKQIVYYAEKGDNKDQVWMMNADGSNQRLLTNNIGHNFYPTWSYDGKRVFFISTRDGSQAVYTMKPDGSDVKKFGEMNSSYLTMSPNGKQIAYIVGRFPKSDIFVANADGSNAVNITAGAASQ
jgi:TolB protein